MKLNKTHRTILKSIAFAAVSILCVLLIFIIILNTNNKILNNVKIEDVDVSKLTTEEASQILKKKYDNLGENTKLVLNYDNENWTYTNDDLNVIYDLDKVVDTAFDIGRNGNFIENVSQVIELYNTPAVLSVPVNVEDKKIDEVLAEIKPLIDREGSEATITRENDIFIIEEEKPARVLNVEQTKKTVNDALLSKNIQEQAEVELTVSVDDTDMNKTYEKLSVIDSLISSFSTNYSTSSWGRKENINLAIEKINNTLLMPGEIFSFNDIVGPRSIDAGFKIAKVIVNNEFVDGVGGGICQVSTTIYNTVLNSELGVVERRNHSRPVGYVPSGRDATVAYGIQDFKFQNTTDYPIFIEAKADNIEMHINFYSKARENDTRVEYVNEVYDVIPYRIVEQKTKNLKPNEREVISKGANGYKVKLYKKTYKGDELISTEEVSNDVYYPKHEDVLVGINE